MATGDKTTATRPVGQSNMRLDLVDYAAMALVGQLAVEAANRSLAATPKATAGAAVGERWLGSMTANPTTGSDGLFRLDSTTFVGLDANGGMLIKPNGTALSITIPAGGASQQVYAYVSDVSENTQVRRFLPATGPFNEFASAINVALRQTVGLYVRAGTLGSVVAQDAVAGITRPLLFLGIATNTGGVVTFTPGTNTLETVRTPASVPQTDSGTTTVKTTVTGSQNTLRELINAALYAVGNAMFKGSDFITPADGNNWGAYNVASLSGGIDKTFRQALGYVIIGNGTTVFGDFNTNAYANSKLLMDAAFASLPAQGGTIIIKRGVQLTNWGGVTCNAPTAKTVVIIGDHTNTPNNFPQLNFATGESITAGSTGALIFQNVHIRWVQNAIIAAATGAGSYLKFVDCYIDKAGAADTGAFITGTTVSDVHFERCNALVSVTSGTANGMLIRATSQCQRWAVKKCNFTAGSADMAWFQFGDMRADLDFTDLTFADFGTQTGATAGVGCFTCASSDNSTVANIVGRRFRNIYNTTSVPTFFLSTAGNLDISNVEQLKASTVAFSASGYSGTGPIKVRHSRIVGVTLAGAYPDIAFQDVTFFGTGSTLGSVTSNQGTIEITRCRFMPTIAGRPILVGGLTINELRVDSCYFEGVFHTTTDIACFAVQANTKLTKCVIQNNEVNGFQNIAWAGGASVYSRCFELDVVTVTSVVFQNNTATNLMSSSSGTARVGVYMLELNSHDRATVELGIGGLVYRNNTIGDDGSRCMMLMVANYGSVTDVFIQNNRWGGTYDNGAANACSLSHIINFASPGSGTQTLSFVKVEGNHMTLLAGAGNMNAIAIDFARFMQFFSVLPIFALSISHNHFDCSSGNPAAFDAVNGFGVNMSFAVWSFELWGNTAIYGASTVVNFFQINIGSAISFNASSGALPTAGSVFTSNIQIKRH